VNEELCNDCSWDSYLSGTTAVIVLIVDDEIHVASVGDSQLFVISDSIKKITSDHTASVNSEKERLLSKGARVEQLWIENKFDGPLRIFKGSLPYPGYE
jgi:serine/threonine protein phosphatase PrpC